MSQITNKGFTRLASIALSDISVVNTDFVVHNVDLSDYGFITIGTTASANVDQMYDPLLIATGPLKNGNYYGGQAMLCSWFGFTYNPNNGDLTVWRRNNTSVEGNYLTFIGNKQ